MNKAQIIMNLSNEQDIRDIDTTITSLGFPSRASYFLHLHYAFKSAVELNQVENLLLRHLGDYGFHNFRETPTVEKLASTMAYDKNDVRKALESLKILELIAEVPYIEGRFQADVKISNEKSYQLTKKGLATVRAIQK